MNREQLVSGIRKILAQKDVRFSVIERLDERDIHFRRYGEYLDYAADEMATGDLLSEFNANLAPLYKIDMGREHEATGFHDSCYTKTFLDISSLGDDWPGVEKDEPIPLYYPKKCVRLAVMAGARGGGTGKVGYGINPVTYMDEDGKVFIAYLYEYQCDDVWVNLVMDPPKESHELMSMEYWGCFLPKEWEDFFNGM